LNFDHGVDFHLRAGPRPVQRDSNRQQFIPLIPSIRPTILVPIQQSSALEQMVSSLSTNPMASSTMVCSGLELLPDSASKIFPSKARLAARAVSVARTRALQPFSHGKDLKGDEGSLTRLSCKIFLSDLVDAHNRGVKHLELHQPVCLEHQIDSGVVFGYYSTPMLLLIVPRSTYTDWPVLAGFDSTFGISSKKFELLGVNVNS
jgi:hypothetical protein